MSTAKGNGSLVVEPGGEAEGTIYFYNVDGNRITHVALAVAAAPAGWDVSIDPPLREVAVSVNGSVVNVSENVNVEPGPLLAQETAETPEGMVCIPVPGRGYALARTARVVVHAPSSAKIGTKGEVRVAAEAFWLGQTGAAAIKQARDFDFSVEVAAAPGPYTEKVLGDAPRVGAPPVGEDTAAGGEMAPALSVQALADKWMPTIVALLVVLAGALIVPQLVSRK
ncbi:MAG: hypothetical protein M0Z94_17205 [Dehalococcoidales bacterium]|nr:hypothetical protein [Dehalococcoidales bacterium]